MGNKRRKYSAEYRVETAQLVITTGRPIATVAEELGVSAGLLGKWVKNERERQGNPDGKSTSDLRKENARLRKELAEARLDNEFLKKSDSLLRQQPTIEEKFQLMWQEKANYTVTRMSRLLEVSRSGFYAWMRRLERRTRGEDIKTEYLKQLDQAIEQVFNKSGDTYGYPRVTAQLKTIGWKVNKKTVAKRMKRMGIEGISPHTFAPITTIQSETWSTIPDRVKRHWDQGALNKVWISDITYLPTWEGWVYLCAVRDAHSRRVIGWAMDSRQTTDLVETALRMAKTLRGMNCEGVVFHADRGSQFTSDQLYRVCKNLDIAQSVERTGICFDNAMAESFWSTLKNEFYSRKAWPTRSEAIRAVARWIEVFYNRQRIHSAIGILTPVEFENKQLTTQAATPKAA